MNIDLILLLGGLILLLSVGASQVSSRFGVPSLLLFLIIGMLAGSEGLGGIYFDDAHYTQALGVVSLCFILFVGGMETEWQITKPVLSSGVVLATFGVFVTAILTGGMTMWLLDLSWSKAMLIGAIVSSTDASAVFTVLRAKKVHLAGQIQPLLEFESGSNDPMAVFLTVGLLQLVSGKTISLWTMIPLFFQQMILGTVIGYCSGRMTQFILNRLRLDIEAMYPILTISLLLLTYAVTQWLNGNGFLAVYLMGITLGNSSFSHKESLVIFHHGISWLGTIAMFVTLGLLVFPSRLPTVATSGAILSLFLIFVARPVAVYLSLLFSKYNLREKSMVAWVGLKGSVPVVLATYPMVAGISGADMIFNLVFFIVLSSVLIQGTSISLVARILRVKQPLGKK